MLSKIIVWGCREVPIYKRISVEELQFWLTDLLSLLRRIYAYPNKEIQSSYKEIEDLFH